MILSIRTGLVHIARLGATMSVLAGASTMAAPPAAFLQPDPATGKPPYSALRVTRGTAVVASDTVLQPCDRVEFVGRTAGLQQVRITTVKGGRNVVLNERQPSHEVSCAAVTQSEAWVRAWRAISGGERAAMPLSQPASTRGTAFAIPVLAAERTHLVAGRRTLHLAWINGTPPYRVVVRRQGSTSTLVDTHVAEATSLRLPELDLVPGQYSIAVFAQDGTPPGLQDDQVFVVPASQLPAAPPEIRSNPLDEDEAELLYVYYLEGLPDGRWIFEAMQRAAAIKDRSPAAAEWLRGYGHR